MITFTCGTYHGLFVDTGTPSVLPKDISYFDLRTRGGRAIPADDTPNLIIRYNSSGEQGGTPMIMVALCYRAIEVNREGFIAFGSLIFEPFSANQIEEGIEAAIKVAKNSTDIFNGKVISSRPKPNEGRPLDLTSLPLLEIGKFFGELNANINSRDTIKNVSEFSSELVSTGIDHYEIAVNPRRGMKHNDLLDHFNYLVSKQKKQIEDLRERTKRLQDLERQEKSLLAQRLIDRRNRNSFLLQLFALGVAGTALLGLAAFIAIKIVFFDDQLMDNNISKKNESSTSDTALNTDLDVTGNGEIPGSGENLDSEMCKLETLSDDDKLKIIIVSDLPKGKKCISISDSVTSGFADQALDQIITSTDSTFTVSDKLPDNKQKLLTTFGRILDNKTIGNSSGKYIGKNHNFVLPDESLSFAISMDSVSPLLICSTDVDEKNLLGADLPVFKFYTEFQYDYRDTLKWFAGGVLLRLGETFVQIGNEINVDEPDNAEITSKANRLKAFGTKLTEYISSEKNLTWTSALRQSQNTCVIVVTEEDKISFQDALKREGQGFTLYTIDGFVQKHAFVAEKYDALIKEKSLTECHKIPGLFMIWNSGQGDRMIMDNTIGLNPYTAKDGQAFEYILKLGKNFGSPEYKLPALKNFSNLREYFIVDENFSPFYEDQYSRKDFCFSPKSVRP